MISLGLHVPVGKRRLPGWSGSVMFYAFKCPKHGIMVDSIPGYDDIPSCQKCVDEKRLLTK